MDLEEALGQFERVETNISRLEAAAREMDQLVPAGISFADTSPQAERYEDLRRSYKDLLAGLPPIDGQSPTAVPLALDDIAQQRMDFADVGEPEIAISTAQAENEAAEDLAEYRHKFVKARRSLVRSRAQELIQEIDDITSRVDDSVPRDGTSMWGREDWQRLVPAIREIERLVGPDLVKTEAQWNAFQRHVGFAQGVDFHDIAETDWPAVKRDIEAGLYSALEPLPVGVQDLASLAATEPTGEISTALAWDALDDDDFERLIFNLLNSASGYEDPRWLMKTRAADKGRDLSVFRHITDPLGENRRERVIVQCRHWLTKSTGPEDCNELVGKMSLWEPPRVDILIIATSGRFTADAVRWVENHNEEGRSPRVEMWPDSHLETLLASRSPLVREFNLRQS